ncbi:pilus assembly protein TadG-related protein [Terriglobus sp. RCC_193]|uniref:pilus assembly protein TadG-related protein n=1 Tax=Terriglobus sp. RCC_193 TaxID=3239218 RepID=UPI003523990D
MSGRSDFHDDSGQVLVVVALCLVVLIGFLGLAVDIGFVRHEQRRLQAAADAAALAGALEVRVCGDSPNCSAMQTAAQTALAENGYSGSTVITDCATPGTALTLMVNNPVCLSSTDPNKSKLNYVEAQISETAPLYFSRVFGVNGFRIKARAQAARGLGGPCIYALNPSASGSLSVLAGLGFQSKCGIVVESKSPTAVTCLIGLMSAPEIRVSGGTSGLLCGAVPPPITGVAPPTPADPLAYLPAPPNANDACGTRSGNVYNGSPKPVSLVLPLGSTYVFNPGVYCGGIAITAAVLSNVTFNPGVYILRNGHNTILGIPGPTTSGLTITIGLLSSIVGNGVMFYNEGDGGSFSITATPALLGLSTYQLTAPTSGNYGGILFFQAHGVTNTGTFLVNLLQGSRMDGVIYMPDALVTYGVGAVAGVSRFNGIVADRIQFTAQILSTIGNDYSTLQSGSPLGGDHSELVQ